VSLPGRTSLLISLLLLIDTQVINLLLTSGLQLNINAVDKVIRCVDSPFVCSCL
jgi:hypothetical protein